MDTPEKLPDSIKKPFMTSKEEQDALAEKYKTMSSAEMLKEMVSDAEKGQLLIDRVILNDNFVPLYSLEELLAMPKDPTNEITPEDIDDAIRQAEAYRAGLF